MRNIVVAQPLPAGAGLRERGKSARRARICAAADRIFRAKGYDQATLREIAAAAQVGAGTIFSYVRDKRELLMMVVNDELGAVTENAFRGVPRAVPLLEQLLHVFRPRLIFWARDPDLARHALHETSGDPHTRETGRFGLGRDRIIEQIAELIRPHQAAGTI
ncbi:MAG TPA: TetR/AcrR family transcriptional regulator, partial [Candidatus Lustribacter sp.]